MLLFDHHPTLRYNLKIMFRAENQHSVQTNPNGAISFLFLFLCCMYNNLRQSASIKCLAKCFHSIQMRKTSKMFAMLIINILLELVTAV